MLNKYTISRKIEEEVARQGISKTELARRTGLNSGTICRYVNGNISRGMSVECVKKIAAALGVTCKDLGMTEGD